MQLAEPLQAAIEEFNKFPGIGRKTAQRLALYLLNRSEEDVARFITVMSELKEKIGFCTVCFNITDQEVCSVCRSDKRDKSVICVVEQAQDIIAIEKTHEYDGLYHALGGVLSPLSGVGQEDLHIKELLERLRGNEVKEIILALNPDTEGETTSLFIAKLVKPLGITVSRIARGLPVGGDIEFADEATIGRAVKSRTSL